VKLEGKAAVVTGGASGQGRAVALLYAKEGARVAVADIDDAGGAETVVRIRKQGGEAIFARCDIASREDVEALMSAAAGAFGGIDILYNNAALNRPDSPTAERVGELSESWWRRTLDVNLTGYYQCAKYALPHLIARGGGVIINVSSVLGLIGGENNSAYVASKHGVVGLTKAMALDYGPQGIRVNAICPGSIDTPRYAKYHDVHDQGDYRARTRADCPLGRIGRPEEIATVALFLACDDSSYVSGCCIPVDGGRAARR
jgi:NAD(P)-dependent dehydrogenase (short-subunit alcohol dehydrogenase family)